MDKLCNHALNKFIISLNNPETKEKLNKELIEPLLADIYIKTQNYFIIIISLYGITILLLLIIISIIIIKKNY